jgi:hypothetical protein
MAPMHSFSVTYAIVLRLVPKDGLVATNSRIVGQREVIQTASIVSTGDKSHNAH